MYEYSEDILVEQPTIELFNKLGYDIARTFHEKHGKNGTLGRETDNEVVLVRKLRAALHRLNPDLPHEAIEQTTTSCWSRNSGFRVRCTGNEPTWWDL